MVLPLDVVIVVEQAVAVIVHAAWGFFERIGGWLDHACGHHPGLGQHLRVFHRHVVDERVALAAEPLDEDLLKSYAHLIEAGPVGETLDDRAEDVVVVIDKEFAKDMERAVPARVQLVSDVTRDSARAKIPGGATAILDHDALPEFWTELVANHARNAVGEAARSRRDNDRDRLAGILLRRRRHARHCAEHGPDQES